MTQQAPDQNPQTVSTALAGPPVTVLPATDSRLFWRAAATILQATGATITALIIAVSQQQATIAPLIPIQFAGIGAAVFAIGKVMEAFQHVKDTVRPKPEVNMSVPADATSIQGAGDSQ